MARTSRSDIADKYRDGIPVTMLTAYDAPIARRVDRGGVDMILVGDTAGDNHLGHEDTIPVTLEEALFNTAADTFRAEITTVRPPSTHSSTPPSDSRRPVRSRSSSRP